MRVLARVHTAIIGGGVMGLYAAWKLAMRLDPLRDAVMVLERTRIGAGSSGRSGAILRCFYADAELVRAARDSLREWEGIWPRTGRWIGFERCGVLTLGAAADRARIERVVASMASLGVEVELLEAEALAARFPALRVTPGGLAAFEPGGATVDPGATLPALAAIARGAGVVVREGARVRSLAMEGGRVRGVLTDDGLLEAERVLLAAGPWSAALLAEAGRPLPLEAWRPEQEFVHREPLAAAQRPEHLEPPQADMDPRFAAPPEAAWRSAHPVLLDLEHGFYARCEPARARTRIGHLDYAGMRVVAEPDALDENVDPAFREAARAALARRAPEYADAASVDALAAWYTMTPDGQAAIGPVPGAAGLFVASGFCGHGFKLAPAVGEATAQMLAGQPVTALDPAFFDPARLLGRRVDPPSAFGL